MSSSYFNDSVRQTTGDRAVQGLLRGLLAGIFMIGYLLAAGISLGIFPEELLSAFNPGNAFVPGSQATPLQGFLLHLGISGVYGTIFGVFARWLPRFLPGWMAGLIYGGLLLVLANVILLPTEGEGLLIIPSFHFAFGHFLFGLILGLGWQQAHAG